MTHSYLHLNYGASFPSHPTTHPVRSTIQAAFNSINSTLYGSYNSLLLNESVVEIKEAMQNGTPPTPGYIFATLLANGTSADGDGDGSDDGGDGSASTGSSTADDEQPNSGPNTSLAM